MRLLLITLAAAVALTGCALKKVKVPLKAEKDSGVVGEALVSEVKGEDGKAVEAIFTATDPKLRPLRGFIYRGTCQQRAALAQDASILPKSDATSAPTRLDGELDFTSLSGHSHCFVVQENTSAGEVLSCGEIP